MMNRHFRATPSPSFLFRLAATLALALPLAALAQAYPDKPIRLIVPFAPGGGNDTVARAITQQFSNTLGQQVYVDNRPGAGGVVGAEQAAHAPGDGYTLFLGGVGSHAVNPNLHPHLSYDPVKDFAPIILIASAPSVLVVYPSVAAKTIQEFTALAKSQPGKLTYASNGNGSSAHLAAAMFESMAGVQMLHVPYKGLAPALSDLLAGQVNSMFSSMVAIIPQIKAGKLRALAVTGKKRSPLLPETPTVAESGLPGYEAGSWYGLLAPAGTPRERVMKINAESNKALANPAVRNTLANEGSDIIGGSPEDFANHIRTEIARMGKVIRDGHIKMAE
ncbi:MAG: tripartite tricarboxylate transporter substrate binding protein [Betaproteobacteria bacterium]|nr:tripartite tricarboxylate transporter substrate binding protein [Betaproteobacteria bacterium]